MHTIATLQEMFGFELPRLGSLSAHRHLLRNILNIVRAAPLTICKYLVKFLADRTNGRAYATVLRLSVCLSVVCDVMYCG